MSNLYIDIKYARLVGQTIERWVIKKNDPFHGNGKCHICGDSQKTKSKRRFHIIQHSDTLFVKCFNCDYSTNLFSYLRDYHPNLFTEYNFERYRVNSYDSVITTKSEPTQEPIKTTQVQLIKLELPYVKDMDKNDPVAVYVASRRLPDYPFQYCHNFYEFSSQFNPDFLDIKKDEPRLIIPFFDHLGNVFAYQGRDLSGKASQKYITVTVNSKVPKIFGIDRIDLKKPIKIVEGPIDSLFLNNSVASVNASLVTAAKKLEKAGINKSLLTLVYDNEPRNKQIVAHYEFAIKSGYNIVVWPSSPIKKEDINDLVLIGKNPEKIIEQNTYSGLSAQLQFNQWKKI